MDLLSNPDLEWTHFSDEDGCLAQLLARDGTVLRTIASPIRFLQARKSGKSQFSCFSPRALVKRSP